jgi:hypothetical protein
MDIKRPKNNVEGFVATALRGSPFVALLTKSKIHSKLHSINLLNVNPSLISPNPRERMFSV